jgi:hypothetical protein
VLALHCIAVVAVLHTFDSVVYWRQLVTKLLDIELGTRDPLEKLNKVPWLKPLVQGWRDNFAIEHAGRYSIVLIVCIEVVEFVTQTTNASQLARYLDWETLGFYVNIIAANSVLFGVCLIVPERFVDESGMVAVDVLIGEQRAPRAKRAKEELVGAPPPARAPPPPPPTPENARDDESDTEIRALTMRFFWAMGRLRRTRSRGDTADRVLEPAALDSSLPRCASLPRLRCRTPSVFLLRSLRSRGSPPPALR